MATPEQNTLLALQLFQPIADQAKQYSDARLNLLTRIAEIQNQERFQKELAAQQAQTQLNYGTQMENLRAANAQALAKDTMDRQLAVTKQQQDALDDRDFKKAFALNYPIYARAAAVLGKTPKPASSYEQSWEGLGQLQGDMTDLQEQAAKHEKSEAAKGVVAVLDQSTQQLENAIKARNEGMKLSAADQQQARNFGIKALQSAAQTGAIPNLDINSPKYTQAVAALSKDVPDIATASQMLGPAGIQAYAGGVQQGLMALQNDKDRIARITSLSRDVQAAQRGASESLSRLMALAANNPQLGSALQQRNAELLKINQQADNITSGPQTPDTNSVFRQMVGSAPSGTSTSVGAPLVNNPTGNSALSNYAQQLAQEQNSQRQQQAQTLAQRIKDLGIQAQAQSQQLMNAKPFTPPVSTQNGLNIAFGAGYGAPIQPLSFDPRPGLAKQLQQTISDQQQAQSSYDALRNILGTGVQPNAGQQPIFNATPPMVPSVAVPNFLMPTDTTQPAGM